MSDFGAYCEWVLDGKKWIFFKKYRTFFKAIYFDNKFYKKKKWPGHLGRWGYKFVGKGSFLKKTPEKLDLPLNCVPDMKKVFAVDVAPAEAEYTDFVNSIGGKFEILDSAKYADKKFNIRFTVYNIYDNAAERYVIYVIGNYDNTSKAKYQSTVRFLQTDLRKWFQDKKDW